MARKMKDSGIEWIGEIPTDFSLYKLKYLLSSPLCYGANESGTLYSDILPRYIRITDISPNGTLKNSGMLSLDESSAQNYMLHEGDILFARSGATVGKSFIYHNYYGRAAYAGYLIKASFNRLVLPEFVYYYTCSSAYEIWKNSIFIQSTIQNIGADRYSNLPISVPNSIDKQLRIVRYLNNFCSKFDAIIYNLQTSIEDYKKLKQAVITQAIIKGVRGEREMKDSGVAWIGEIPAEWSITKIKSGVTKIGSGKTPSGGAETYTDSGVIFLRSQNVYDCTLNLESPTYISPEVDATMKSTRVLPDDVLLNITGGSIGRCSIVPKTLGLANVNQHVCIIRTNPLIFLPKYMQYFWVSTLGHLAIDLYQTGGNREGMSADAIRNTPIPYAPLNEQKEIADYLDAKCAEIDGLIAKKEQLVKELESYKKSLIYEVVTGKREV